MAKFKEFLKHRYTGSEIVSKNPIDPSSRFVGVNSVYAAVTPGEPEYNSEQGEVVRRTLGDVVREAVLEARILEDATSNVKDVMKSNKYPTPKGEKEKKKKSGKWGKIRKVAVGIIGAGGTNKSGTSAKGFLHPKVSQTDSPSSSKSSKNTSSSKGASKVPVIGANAGRSSKASGPVPILKKKS